MPLSANNLNDNANYTVEAVPATGPVAVTVLTLKSNGSVGVASLTSPNGSFSVGNGVARVMFIVNGLPADSGTFKVTQSGATLVDTTWGGSTPSDLIVTFTIV
jgi:hypothetical protein